MHDDCVSYSVKRFDSARPWHSNLHAISNLSSFPSLPPTAKFSTTKVVVLGS